MAATIKGITIEIGANTTGLGKALEEVNKKARSLQSELKQVDSLLKLNPGNAELVAQKQELLARAVANAKEKLETLRAAQVQVSRTSGTRRRPPGGIWTTRLKRHTSFPAPSQTSRAEPAKPPLWGLRRWALLPRLPELPWLR